MKNYEKNADTAKSLLIGVLFIVTGIYLFAGYDIFNSRTFWSIIGIIFIVKGLSFIRI